MNAKQISAAALFTAKIEKANRYFSTGEPLNGYIVWEQLKWEGNDLILAGSNTDTARWFEKHISLIVKIGPRGGVKILSSHGL